MDSSKPSGRLIEEIAAVARTGHDELDLRAATERIRARMLEYGSETPSNLEAAELVFVAMHEEQPGVAPQPEITVDREGKIAVSDILYYAQGVRIPDELAECLPGVTQEQWDAAMRFAVLALYALTDQKS